MRATKKNFSPIVVYICFFLFWFAIDLSSEEAIGGNVIGFVYAHDGTTPFEGAIIKAKNVTTGIVYESNKSDKYGAYRIRDVEKGVYFIGVESLEGDFNVEGLVGLRIADNETAKMSLSLRTYEQRVTTAIQEINQQLKVKEEVLIGRVVAFNPNSGMAEISVTKGLLRVNDRIHTKGRVTDFYQALRVIRQEGAPVEVILAGDDATIGLKRKAVSNDAIYVVRKKGFFPLFLIPVGVATIVAGSSSVVKEIVTIHDEPIAASPFKK